MRKLTVPDGQKRKLNESENCKFKKLTLGMYFL